MVGLRLPAGFKDFARDRWRTTTPPPTTEPANQRTEFGHAPIMRLCAALCARRAAENAGQLEASSRVARVVAHDWRAPAWLRGKPGVDKSRRLRLGAWSAAPLTCPGLDVANAYEGPNA
jgi:hypothetical protein